MRIFPRSTICLLLTAMLTACVTRPPATPPAPPPAPALPPASGLRVALVWSAPVDLDLYLTDPTWETVYFANNPSHTGAQLLRDTRCRDVASSGDTVFVELAAIANPLPGHYRVGVDFIDACQTTPKPVSFRVVAEYGNVRREVLRTIQLEEFQPIVVEFVLRATGPDGSLTLVQEGQ